MVSAEHELVYHPAVALTLIMVSAAALIAAVMSLRNAHLWLRLVTGRRASGVVTEIGIITSATGEVLRRPIVMFSTEDGTEVVTAPVLFRKSVQFAKGAAVTVSYVRRRPTRIVVHGYDFRLREPIFAVLALLTAIGIAATYFRLL